MKEFDILDRNTNIFSSYFIEASAGTGKTFSIEHLIIRLLIESNPRIEIWEILAVTFTRAAARELKGRVYSALIETKRSLQGAALAQDYLQPLLVQGGEPLYQAKRRIEEAICLFDRSQIFTLHGFCQQMLQSFDLEHSLKPNQTDFWNLRDLVFDFFRQGLDLTVLSKSQLNHLIGNKSFDSLYLELVSLWESGLELETFPTFNQILSEWNRVISSFYGLQAKELWDQFRKQAPRLASSKKRIAQADRFFLILEQGSIMSSDLDLLIDEQEFFLSALKTVEGILLSLKQAFCPLYERLISKQASLFTLARLGRPYYRKAKIDSGIWTPNDLVASLKEKTSNPQILSAIQKLYKAAIIDEFQDTDLLQWELFCSCFLQNLNLFCYLVGDPKQSIYAFRKADVYLYLRARESFENQVYLGTNFRSHPNLVEGLNHLFSWNLPKEWMILPKTNQSLEVRNVLSKPTYPSPINSDTKGTVHFWLIEEPNSFQTKWPTYETEESILFPHLAHEILHLQKTSHICLNEIAILVKDRFQAARLQRFLTESGISTMMEKRLNIEENIGYQEFECFLQLLSKPDHLPFIKRLLAGPLFCTTHSEIQGGFENPFIQKLSKQAIELGFILEKEGLSVAFTCFLEFSLQECCLAELLLKREDSSIYFELRQALCFFLEGCPEGFYDLSALLKFIKKIDSLPKTDDLFKQPIEESADRVNVMTLHRSKGLEFSVVFALAIASRGVYQEDTLGLQDTLVVSKGRTEDLSRYKAELDAEKLRQLYVALTRAKERVYIPVFAAQESTALPFGSAAPIELLLGAYGQNLYLLDEIYQKLGSMSISHIKTILKELSNHSSINFEQLEQIKPPQKEMISLGKEISTPPVLSEDKQLMHSFSSIASGAHISHEEIAPQEIPLGAQTGTLIHKILETICTQGLHQELGEKTFNQICSIVKNSFLEGKEELIYELVKKSLLLPLFPDGTSLSMIQTENIQVEIEFLYPTSGNFMKGFIDLIFKYQEKYYILDWKTNFLASNYDLEKIMEENEYFLQASIYTQALERYLFLVSKKPFQEIFGGVFYFFLRGPAYYYQELICSTL